MEALSKVVTTIIFLIVGSFLAFWVGYVSLKNNAKKKSIKVIIVPGNGGDKVEDKWFPYVQHKLEEKGIKVINVEFPDLVLARKEYWLPFFEKVRHG